MAGFPARAFFLPGTQSPVDFLRALEALGYRAGAPAPAAPETTVLTFFDTWNGALGSAGYRLLRDEADGQWVLRRKKRAVATARGVGVTVPPPGDLADLTVSLSKDNPYIPHLALETTLHRMSVAGSTSRPLHLEVRRLVARSVHRPGEAIGLLVSIRPSGDPSQDKRLRSVLRGRLGARKCPEELFALGMDVLGVPLPGTCVPERWVPSENDGAGEIAAKVIGAQLHRLRACHAGATYDLDPEYVHEMRVAARTARQALRLFRPWLDRACTDHTARELSWLGGKLGAVRDHDVLLGTLRKELPQAIADPAAREAVTGLVRRARGTALSELGEALSSARSAGLMEELDAMALRSRGQGPDGPEAGARAAGARIVRKVLARVKAEGGGSVKAFGDQELHRMRILFRRLRYACELFVPVYGKRMRRILPLVVAFQDCLGRHQDAAVARGRLLGLAREVNGEAAGALQTLAQSKLEALAASRLQFVEAWRAFPDLARRLRRCVGRRHTP